MHYLPLRKPSMNVYCVFKRDRSKWGKYHGTVGQQGERTGLGWILRASIELGGWRGTILISVKIRGTSRRPGAAGPQGLARSPGAGAGFRGSAPPGRPGNSSPGAVPVPKPCPPPFPRKCLSRLRAGERPGRHRRRGSVGSESGDRVAERVAELRGRRRPAPSQRPGSVGE